MVTYYEKCLWHLPYAKADHREEQEEALYAFGEGTKRRSSLALALAHGRAVTGVGAELLMCKHRQRMSSGVTAAGGSTVVPGQC